MISSRLYPETIFLNRKAVQLVCSLMMRQEMYVLVCLHPVCLCHPVKPITLSSIWYFLTTQPLMMKIWMMMIWMRERQNRFPTLLLLLSISHGSRALSSGKTTPNCHLVSLAEWQFFAVPTLMHFFMGEEFSALGERCKHC